MIQIYHGDGKGKTTAAVGLSIRAIGSEKPVYFAQFLKDDSSSEISVLKEQKDTFIFHAKEMYGFVWNMTEDQKGLQKKANDELLSRLEDSLGDSSFEIRNSVKEDESIADNDIKAVIVLDEVIHAINNGLLTKERLYDFVDRYSRDNEIILTGTNPPDELIMRADYITEVKKVKHPFDKGIAARKSIEY